MLSTPRSFYVFFSAFLFLGWVWLCLQFSSISFFSSHSVCIIKTVTGYPCPSCGTTRAIVTFFSGDVVSAFFINPLFFPILFTLLLFPFWLLYDFAFNRTTFMKAYESFETTFQRPVVWIPFMSLIVLNWIWNVTKGI